MYNYYHEMKLDVANEIKYWIESEYVGISAFVGDKAYSKTYNRLYEDFWTCDSITGNGSGSYTFCRATAEEYVKDNLPLCVEACIELGIEPSAFGERIYNADWEYLDVTIRCYLLGQILTEIMDYMADGESIGDVVQRFEEVA